MLGVTSMGVGSSLHQYEWDVIDYEDPGEDRTEFVQDAHTYKRLNKISSKEEFYPGNVGCFASIRV